MVANPVSFHLYPGNVGKCQYFSVELLVYQEDINCSFQKMGAFAYLWQGVSLRHIKGSYVSHTMSEYKAQSKFK